MHEDNCLPLHASPLFHCSPIRPLAAYRLYFTQLDIITSDDVNGVLAGIPDDCPTLTTVACKRLDVNVDVFAWGDYRL